MCRSSDTKLVVQVSSGGGEVGQWEIESKTLELILFFCLKTGGRRNLVSPEEVQRCWLPQSGRKWTLVRGFQGGV